MKTKTTVKVVVFAGFLVILSTVLFAETVKLSTYYPAPFGAYDRVKLVPRETLPIDPYCDDMNDLGTMYYDKGSGELAEAVYVCQRISKDSMTWVPVSGQYY